MQLGTERRILMESGGVIGDLMRTAMKETPMDFAAVHKLGSISDYLSGEERRITQEALEHPERRRTC